MQYIGSKRRLAKHLLPIILKDRQPDQWYIEPFVGGANMIENVPGPNVIGADADIHTIRALHAIRDTPTLLPKDSNILTKEAYQAVQYKYRNTPHKITDVDCYVLIACAFRGVFNRGYSGGLERDNCDRIASQYRAAQKQSKLLQDKALICTKYNELILFPNSIIYCDPPYQSTQGYGIEFNHDEFWQWCRDKHKEGHTIFVSEYNAPGDFTCIWERELINNLNTKKATEKLFTLNK
jgi:DNA adenine methylase